MFSVSPVMNAAGKKIFQAKAPDRGSFPLDHDGKDLGIPQGLLLLGLFWAHANQLVLSLNSYLSIDKFLYELEGTMES